MAQRQKVKGQRRPGSQQALRELNSHRILEVLAVEGPHTQSDLARLTGLSGGTVSNIVRKLAAAGTVSTEAAVVGGRRATKVALRPTNQFLLGIDIGRTHLTMSLTDSARKELATHDSRLPENHSPEETFPYVESVLQDLLKTSGIAKESIASCVIALPASIRSSDYSIVQDTVFHTWAGRDLRAMAQDYLGIDVHLENDANVGALAQIVCGDYPSARNLLYVKVASGIGLGLVQSFSSPTSSTAIDGPRIYSSSTGLTGEIGHTQFSEAGEVCYCGNRGCLETIASLRALVANLDRIRPGKKHNTDSILTAANEGDVVVSRMLTDAGGALGRSLSTHINVLAPDAVVIGGPLSPLGDSYLDLVVPAARQRLLPAVDAAVDFSITSLGTRAEVLGCVALAAQMMWTSPRA